MFSNNNITIRNKNHILAALEDYVGDGSPDDDKKLETLKLLLKGFTKYISWDEEYFEAIFSESYGNIGATINNDKIKIDALHT